MDLSGLIQALKLAEFRRVAVQVSDSKLHSSRDLIDRLQSALPDSNVSLLGDSVTECCLDETSAEHYGADCIVKLGHCCWFASQRLPSFFIEEDLVPKEDVLSRFLAVRADRPSGPVFLFVDSVSEVSDILSLSDSLRGDLFVCLSPAVSYPGSNKPQINWFTCRPFSSAFIVPIAARFQASRSDFPRVAGRVVFHHSSEGFHQILDQRVVDMTVDHPDSSFVTTREDSLYLRLVNRFGTTPGRVFCSPEMRASNYKELLRRYRGVEAVKNASSIGLVVTHCAASEELFKVRDLLTIFLRAAGKEVFMFSVGKADGVKLGNFLGIDCFVIMACPESEYFESDDLMADCVSPFEALVAVESLDWSDHVITDYDEMLGRMLMEPPPRTPRTPRRKPAGSAAIPASQLEKKLAPARIENGLRGVPSRYISEPSVPQQPPSSN